MMLQGTFLQGKKMTPSVYLFPQLKATFTETNFNPATFTETVISIQSHEHVITYKTNPKSWGRFTLSNYHCECKSGIANGQF